MDPDLELLDRWCEGDKGAGNALFKRHFDDVFRFFEHKVAGDAEELVQETFLACVRRRAEFRRQSTFRTFLFAIARFELYAYWRRRDRRGAKLDFAEISLGDLVTSVATRMARETDRERLLRALQSLPLESQLLLELHYWEGMTSEQLAEVFEIAPVTARTRLFRARQALRARMEAEDAALPAEHAEPRESRAPSHAEGADEPDDAERATPTGRFDRWVSSLRARRRAITHGDADPS